MTSYFKYTNGEAFTLDNDDYVGFLHITDGKVYSGREYTEDSVELTPKQTFMADIYSRGMNLNTCYTNIDTLSNYYSNVFDILNKQGLDDALNVVDTNNLICFKNLILSNPTVYKFEDNGNHYYGLTSISDDATGKSQTKSIIGFQNTEWEFLDNVIAGTFVVNTNEDFKYLCSDGVTNYILGGNFNNPSELTILYSQTQHPFPPAIGEYTDYTYYIHNDPETNQIFLVNNDFITIYDGANFSDCNNLLTVDRISLSSTETIDYIWDRTHITWNDAKFLWNTKFKITNPNNPEFMRFGKNIRTLLDGKVLRIINKYSSDIFNTIDLESYFTVGDILSLDVRDIDDNILILHKISNELYVIFLDPNNLTSISNTQISSIEALSSCKIKFSAIDSDIFHTYSDVEYQTRYLSVPSYPTGRLEISELGYPERYKWNTANFVWKLADLHWGSGKFPSNFYKTLLSSEVIQNNKMYMLLHNLGRIYALNQPVDDRFLNNISLDTQKFFDGTVCSESSIGLYFNSSIINIVKDTLNLFNQASGSFTIGEREVYTKELQDFVLETENLYLNGNETINIVSLQRIFLLITEIQTRLLPESLKNG